MVWMCIGLEGCSVKGDSSVEARPQVGVYTRVCGKNL